MSGSTIICSIERARTEFDAGVETVLGELNRVAQSTKLNPEDLRKVTLQRLEQFAIAAKEASQAEQFRRMTNGIDRFIDEQFAAFDQHLQFAVRQFSVGFLIPPEPEVPPVSNSITIGSMIGSTIQQGSPGAKQTAEIALNFENVTDALTRFESEFATVTLPKNIMEELKGDISTIRTQLQKPSPSRLIIKEAGKSLRNVVEGIAGGMLTPAAMTAAALWSALALS